jgi:hypothetical protein
MVSSQSSTPHKSRYYDEQEYFRFSPPPAWYSGIEHGVTNGKQACFLTSSLQPHQAITDHTRISKLKNQNGKFSRNL